MTKIKYMYQAICIISVHNVLMIKIFNLMEILFRSIQKLACDFTKLRNLKFILNALISN